MKICTDEFVPPFYHDCVYLDTIKHDNYNSEGFEGPESDLFM